MDTLFPLEPEFPEGFSYYPHFITEAEEKTLLDEISAIQLHAFTFQGYEAKRKVASFGYDYSFDRGRLEKGSEIPEPFHFIIDKAANVLGIAPEEFQELLITEYPADSVINWHRDAPPFELIAGISLQADCLFKLRPYDKAKQKRNAVISFTVSRRSLYIISGPARSDWQHSIAPVQQTRYSITLRTLKK